MYKSALEPEYYAEPDDYVHRDDIKCYEDAKEWIEEIIECIYKKGDMEQLENALEELADIWDLKVPETEPILEKVMKTTPQPMTYNWSSLRDSIKKQAQQMQS